jgi:hypothetical protein
VCLSPRHIEISHRIRSLNRRKVSSVDVIVFRETEFIRKGKEEKVTKENFLQVTVSGSSGGVYGEKM